MTVAVTITSDLMCPWCWVGLRKLQAASKVANVDTKIVWKPFMLRPNIPAEGTPKGGSPASRVPLRLKEAGAAVGIDFTGKTDTTPNTTLFHAAMKYLLDQGHEQTPFQEAVFDAYFTQGIFPDQQGLLECAAQVDACIQGLFDDDAMLQTYQAAVHREASEASMRGVSGVPFFEFNGEPAFSGAQSVNTFVECLTKYEEADK